MPNKIVQAIAEVYRHQYRSYGDYSVTTLLSPPREVQLCRRHADEIEVRPEKMVASMIGTATHEYIEKMLRLANMIHPEWELERSVYDSFEIEPGVRRLVAGRFDILENGKHLHDNKVVNVWKVIFDPDMEEWTQQQNLYAYLLHRRGVDVESLTINAWFKDWKEGNAVRDRSYPQNQTIEYQLPLWSWEESEAFLMDRLTFHYSCEKVDDKNLPVCTAEERWERFDDQTHVHYAIFKDPKAKRAHRVIKTTFDDAVDYLKKWKGRTSESFIEERFPIPRKCIKYCDAAPFCSWFQMWKQRNDEGQVNQIHPAKYLC